MGRRQPLHEWQELEVGPGAGAVQDLTTWLFEEESFAPLAKLTSAGAYSVVCDHLGTPLELLDAGGAPTWRAQLDSYGGVREGQGTPQDCPFRYQGQYEDAETGLYYNRFRYYDPEAGQYISQDPIGLLGGLAAYAYVTDPHKQVDVFGLSAGCGTVRKSNSWNDFQKKTQGQFPNRAQSLAEYRRLKAGTSPWPKDYVPQLETMKVGERVRMRWSRQGGQKKDVYFFCYGNQNQRVVARQTAQIRRGV